MNLKERIRGADLTAAERRVAEVAGSRPEAVAFGTVAALAAEASTSGPTVVRFANKLGYDGFVGLQAAVQDELAGRLRPAAERISRPADDPLGRALADEVANVADTLSGVDRTVFATVVRRLADRRRVVAVVSGEASFGVAHLFADALGMLRDGVRLVTGSPVRVAASMADLGPDDTLVAIDLRRYERWVLDTVRASPLHRVAVTDSLVSPLAEVADEVFVVRAVGAGPFDSHTGTLALANAILAGVAGRLRGRAGARLEAVERAWRSSDALADR